MFSKFKYTFGRLEITVFATGMIVMIIEMVGARILAPFFGNSIFVWTSIIGVILASLSFGYYYGGRLADIYPKYRYFGLIILLSGCLVGLVAVFKQLALSSTMLLGIKLGSVVGSLLIFALPSMFLGMVSPFAVRLKIDQLKTSGKTVGYLYALSTLGSIFGTFLAGFWLISFFGNTIILYFISLVLIFLAMLAGKFRKKAQLAILILAVIMLGVFYTHQKLFAKADYLLEKDTSYNHIRVIDSMDRETGREIRAMLMGQTIHSIIYLDSGDLYSGYTRHYRLDQLFNHDIKRALMIGGGAYTVPQDVLKRFPGVMIDVVEIDPEVTKIAYNFFGLNKDERLNILHQDGRIFLNNNRKIYDAIYMDAFGNYYSIPFQLTTIETAEKIFNSLNDDGVVLVNIIGALTGEKSDLVWAEHKTYSTIFPQVYLFGADLSDGKKPEDLQNVMLIASKKRNRQSITELKEAAKGSYELGTYLNNYHEAGYDPDKVELLTDEFAPVDNYVLKYL